MHADDLPPSNPTRAEDPPLRSPTHDESTTTSSRSTTIWRPTTATRYQHHPYRCATVTPKIWLSLRPAGGADFHPWQNHNGDSCTSNTYAVLRPQSTLHRAS